MSLEKETACRRGMVSLIYQSKLSFTTVVSNWLVSNFPNQIFTLKAYKASERKLWGRSSLLSDNCFFQNTQQSRTSNYHLSYHFWLAYASKAICLVYCSSLFQM